MLNASRGTGKVNETPYPEGIYRLIGCKGDKTKLHEKSTNNAVPHRIRAADRDHENRTCFCPTHSNYKVGGTSIPGSLVYRVRSDVSQAVGQGAPEFRQFRVPQCGATTVS